MPSHIMPFQKAKWKDIAPDTFCLDYSSGSPVVILKIDEESFFIDCDSYPYEGSPDTEFVVVPAHNPA